MFRDEVTHKYSLVCDYNIRPVGSKLCSYRTDFFRDVDSLSRESYKAGWIMIDDKHYCPYCAKRLQEIVNV